MFVELCGYTVNTCSKDRVFHYVPRSCWFIMFVVRVNMTRATSNSIPCIAQLQYAPEVEFEDTELNILCKCVASM